MDTRDYFYACRPAGHPQRRLFIRVGNALYRAGIKTMDQLYALPEHELARVRNLGAKGQAVAREARRQACAGT